ncbi:hypothetical protein SCHPADRAFT_432732 [Schizopora paradoxa]|uniref:Uncharacterized protein n=1 Tax=Schizopora paradoxa TaxID=27342 RepID=A0A0H2RKS7_9AGAM|nr:hypothetical protein SCHPADRAFT_432732 [Schizopora paradoxa]
MNFFTQSAIARPQKLYTRAKDRIGQRHVLRVLEPISITLSAVLIVVATFSTPFIPAVALMKIFIDTEIYSTNGTEAAPGNISEVIRWTTVESTIGLWGYCSEGVTL